MIELASLLVGDPPQLWSELGFRVEDGAAVVSGVRHQLGSEGRGIRAWSLRGTEAEAVDGLPLDPPPPVPDNQDSDSHPNGVLGLDHVVLLTPDLARTIGAFEGIGLQLRRTRDAEPGGTPMRQAFFRLGPVILEIVGPRDRPSGGGPPRFYGLAFTVQDLDATAALLGDRLRPAKPAVQAGRRIATLDKAAGSTIAVAFMSPAKAST